MTMRPRLSDRWLGPEPLWANRKAGWGIVLAALFAYVMCFVLLYPPGITVDDESTFLDQARLFATGQITIPKLNPLTGKEQVFRDDFYPVGTAVLMAPFILIFGWRGAYLVPLLGLVVAVLITGRWLQEEKRSPLFALFVLGFPATLVMGRVAMSDVPSMAIVVLGLWLFWRGLDRGWWYWLLSGFVAAVSLTFRDTNAVVFTPFYLGTLIRRESRCWALIAGGVSGLSLKLLSNYLAFGDLLYVRIRYLIDPPPMAFRLTVYALGLLVCVPGGLIFVLAYRGRRRPELVASIVLFLTFFAVQWNGTTASALSKNLILQWRYLLAILPIVVFGMAESVPRLWRWIIAGREQSQVKHMQLMAGVSVTIWVTAIVTGSVFIQAAFQRWSRTQVEIENAIHEHTEDSAVLIINKYNTRKFIRNLERPLVFLDRDDVSSQDVSTLLARYGKIYLVFIDRSDASFRLSDAERNAAFVASLHPSPKVEFDHQITAQDRLRIWVVVRENDEAKTSQDRKGTGGSADGSPRS